MQSWQRALGSLVVASALLAVAVGAMFSAGGGGFWLDAGVAMLYGLAIGTPVMFAYRRMRPRLGRKTPLVQWVAYIGVLLVATVIGTTAVRALLLATGVFPPGDGWEGFAISMEVSLAIALPASFASVAYHKLRHRLVETETLAIEARLASLESRIRPHFLFNALNSAIALIPEEPRAAERVLERLAALLRFSLDGATARAVTLAEELRVVEDYLEIERVRFGARLAYSLDIAPAARDLRVPAFAVQTLVENSVKYAVSPRVEGAAIAIRARADAGRLRVEVRDDGPGFGDANLWQPGHGLDGLRARLDALYGARATLVAPLPSASGAAVAIEIPAERIATIAREAA